MMVMMMIMMTEGHAIAGVEIACNLLDSSVSAPHHVDQAVQRLAGQKDVAVGQSYRIGQTPEALTALARKILDQ